MSDEEKKKIGNLLPGVEAPKLSEEEWAERDSKIAEAEAAREKREKVEAWKKTKLELRQNGLALRHLEILFSGAFVPTPALEAVKQLSGEAGLYVLSGNVGCGKTLAAHAWMLEGAPSGWKSRGIRLATASWFARTSRYGGGGEKFALLSEPAKLVLDDLGVEYADEKESFLVDLDELLDLRWRDKSLTLLTTNLGEQDFRERYGQRIFDRVRGERRWFNVRHESLRGGK